MSGAPSFTGCDAATSWCCAPRMTAWTERPTPALLDRVTALGYVLFTQDVDFLVEAARRRRIGQPFSGVIFSDQQNLSDRECIDDLELLAKAYDPPDMMNQVVYLPI